MERITRYAQEYTVAKGSLLLSESTALKTCFLIKSGTVELFSHKAPVSKRLPEKEYIKTFVDLTERGEQEAMALGLNEGNMSDNFR